MSHEDLCPYVTSNVDNPSFSEKATIKFLVDTGAKFTIIPGLVVQEYGIDLESLEELETPATTPAGRIKLYALHGTVLYFVTIERVLVGFIKDSIMVTECTGDPLIDNIPCILGRDFLSRYDCKLLVDYGRKKHKIIVRWGE